MNPLLSQLTTTQKGAVTLKSSGSAVVDLFGSIGALRKASSDAIVSRFEAAFNQDKTLAARVLFYARDVRGGQGERKVFRVILSYLAQKYPDVARQLLPLVAEYGRWDDLLELALTPLEEDAFSLIKTQLDQDIASYQSGDPSFPVSLLAKWLYSENASNKARVAVARRLIKFLGLTPREYRKTLAALRARINVVERQMCAKDWANINYDNLPGRAGLVHRNAFLKNDETRYRGFLGEVTKGTKKLKTKVLYPYEVIAPIFGYGMTRVGERLYPSVQAISEAQEQALTAYWNSLPNYFGDKERNVLAVVDTSGSMRGLPIQVAVSLGLYCAERNKGPFNGYFFTFSVKPQLQKVKGNTLSEKVRNLVATDWDDTTNLEALFDLLLNTAVKSKIKPEDMPKQLLLISDMEFDQKVAPMNDTLINGIKNRYKECGYEMPSIAFWNVNARTQQSPVRKDEKGFLLVSGCNPNILVEVLSGTTKTAEELMLEKLNSPRYEKIVVK